MGSTLWDYYVRTARELTHRSLKGIDSLDTWKREREDRLKRFYTTMGIYPLPERCGLKPVISGEFAGEGYRVEKVSFEILPDVHAAANIYRPDPLPPGKLPGVLYVCGHYLIGVQDFQEHPIMWARRGYICLILDSIEQHDNRGDHHAVHLGKRADWISRGYNASGGELWSGMRALDLLFSLPEVDPERVGVTGLSGGGAQSFFIAVADERIKAVATVCGIAVLQPMYEERQWQRLCDCMFPYNMFRQDSADWGALIAPRPLLFCYARGDDIFSPEASRLLHEKVRGIYSLYGIPELCELFEYPGAHGYQPETVSAINRWFDNHVAGEDHPMMKLPEQVHNEETITIFDGLVPEDDHLDLLPELLSRRGSVPLPHSMSEWKETQEKIKSRLLAGPLSWVANSGERLTAERHAAYLRVHNETPETERNYLVYSCEIAGVDVWTEMSLPARVTGKVIVGVAAPTETAVEVMGRLLHLCGGHGVVTIEPRGSGLTALDHGNRAFGPGLLRAGGFIGLTETLIAIHDTLLILDFLRSVPELKGQKLYLYGRGDAGVASLYAAILDEKVAGVVADTVRISHTEGGRIIGILPVMDIPHAVGLVAPRPLAIPSFGILRALWGDRAYRRLGCEDRFLWGCRLDTGVDRVLNMAVDDGAAEV